MTDVAVPVDRARAIAIAVRSAGGRALIVDLRKDASIEEIEAQNFTVDLPPESA